jgi:hypothetical protein
MFPGDKGNGEERSIPVAEQKNISNRKDFNTDAIKRWRNTPSEYDHLIKAW